MAWWLLMIIIIGFVLGLGFAGFGLYSSWKWQAQTNGHDWETYFENPKTRLVSGDDKPKYQRGLVVMVVGKKWSNGDAFLPFLTFAAPNIDEACYWWMETIRHDYLSNHESPIVNYLLNTNQSLDSLSFHLLKPLKNEKNLEKSWSKYIKKLNFANTTFDNLIYNF